MLSTPYTTPKYPQCPKSASIKIKQTQTSATIRTRLGFSQNAAANGAYITLLSFLSRLVTKKGFKACRKASGHTHTLTQRTCKQRDTYIVAQSYYYYITNSLRLIHHIYSTNVPMLGEIVVFILDRPTADQARSFSRIT